MSDQTTSFSVLLVRAPDDDPLKTSERVAAVLGYDVQRVLAVMHGREVRLLETHDEREALRVTASLRMRQLEVRYVPSHQWQAAVRAAGSRVTLLSDIVTASARSSNSSTPGNPTSQPGDAREPLPASTTGPRVSLSQLGGGVYSPPDGAGVLSQRSRGSGDSGRFASSPGVRGVTDAISDIGSGGTASTQGSAIFRLARRTGSAEAVSGSTGEFAAVRESSPGRSRPSQPGVTGSHAPVGAGAALGTSSAGYSSQPERTGQTVTSPEFTPVSPRSTLPSAEALSLRPDTNPELFSPRKGTAPNLAVMPESISAAAGFNAQPGSYHRDPGFPSAWTGRRPVVPAAVATPEDSTLQALGSLLEPAAAAQSGELLASPSAGPRLSYLDELQALEDSSSLGEGAKNNRRGGTETRDSAAPEHGFERSPSMASIPSIPVASPAPERRRRTSGGSRTIDFDLETPNVTGSGVPTGFEEEEELERRSDTSSSPAVTSGNFGSFEDELASVSAMHEPGGSSDDWSRVSSVSRRTTGTSTPVAVRQAPRNGSQAAVQKSGGGLLLLVATALLGIGLGALALWVNHQSTTFVSQFANAGFYAEFVEGENRYGCGRMEDGSQLCRANEFWFASTFPGLRPSDTQLASDSCFFRRTDTGSTYSATLQCSFATMAAGGEAMVHLQQTQRRDCEPALETLAANAESTCRLMEESSMRIDSDPRPSLASHTETWQVRLQSERASLPTPAGSLSAREYRVMPSIGAEFIWSWSPDVAGTVRETPIGGVARTEISGRISPSGRQGISTLR